MDTIKPGDRVLIDGEIAAVVERVIHCRGMAWPLLLVEWWHNGDVRSREVHATDVVREETT